MPGHPDGFLWYRKNSMQVKYIRLIGTGKFFRVIYPLSFNGTPKGSDCITFTSKLGRSYRSQLANLEKTSLTAVHISPLSLYLPSPPSLFLSLSERERERECLVRVWSDPSTLGVGESDPSNRGIRWSDPSTVIRSGDVQAHQECVTCDPSGRICIIYS